MRLTDEQIKVFKEGKKRPGLYIYDLFDTIEALQQEYDELDTGHSKLFKVYCALQERNGVMAAALKQAREALKSVSFRSGLGSDEETIREALAAIDKVVER